MALHEASWDNWQPLSKFGFNTAPGIAAKDVQFVVSAGVPGCLTGEMIVCFHYEWIIVRPHQAH